MTPPRSSRPAQKRDPISPERFQQIEGVFDAAADAPFADRPAILDRLCGDDDALRAEVLRLLAGLSGARVDIKAAIEREASAITADTVTAARARIGPYRLERELGRGGMGAVFLAARDDDAYRTKVAIKLLHRGLETAGAVARFRDERQILASLSHRGIVRLLDGGNTEEGLPYLVMEHVEGAPITRWASVRGLEVRARVELFREVCAAVAYAHQRLVVHRDIKPSNILVMEDGTPKLLDFGIAKLLDPEAGREAITRTGMHLLTPEYASPEQVRGEPATTSVDVYALGAVLYELLCGAPAQRPLCEGIDALRAVLEVEPALPSAAAPAARRREIAGDLDNITMKALQKESSRRYASAEQLAGDLGRYLDGLPVQAREGRWTYRAGKLLKRRRGAAFALALVITSLSVATVVSVSQARRADAAARVAEEQAKRAKRRFDDVRQLASSLLFEVDGKIASVEGTTEARELVTRRALEYLDGLAGEAGDDPALARERALGYLKVAAIQGSTLAPNLGRPRDGLFSCAKAKRIVDELIAKGRDEVEARWVLVRILFAMADLRWALLEGDEARALGKEGMELVESLPDDERFEHLVVVQGYGLQLSIAIFHDGDAVLATRYAGAINAVTERWARVDPTPDASYWRGMGRSVRAMTTLLGGDPEGAMRDQREATSILSAVSEAVPDNLPYRREVWFARTLTAMMLAGQGDLKIWVPSVGDFAAAERELRETLPLAERMAARDHDDMRAAVNLVETLDELGAVVAARDPAAALPFFERARSVFAGLRLPQQRSEYARQYERSGRCAMAVALAKQGRRADALAAIDVGLSIALLDATAAASLNDRASPSMCRFQAAQARISLGDEAAAVELLFAAAGDLRALCAPKPSTLLPYIGLVEVLLLHASLRPARRCALLEEAVLAWRSWPGTPTSYTRRRLSELLAAAGAAGCPKK